MKFMHLSDLHLGIRIGEVSLIEDQEYILNRLLETAESERIDTVIIAGDIYDKSIPSAEATRLFDDFLTGLAAGGYTVIITSGNHDSAERLAYAGRLLENRNIYISPVFNGSPAPVTLKDEYGDVDIYPLPFLKTAHIKKALQNDEIENTCDGIKLILENLQINPSSRNILVTHQFVTGAVSSDDIIVGGTDNVDASLFSKFDYTALGHIHGPQNIGGPSVRYCGSPLKYSFSEARHVKTATIIELHEKGAVNVYESPLSPLRDMRELKGSYFDITAKSSYEGTQTDDYMHITLTDEEDIPDVIGKLRSIYPNTLRVDYDNRRTRENNLITGYSESKSPLELFEEFYELQNNAPMTKEQISFAKSLMDEIWI